jgi:hypothetical protein
LINFALRPLEFFNLTSVHGHTFHLHDDFYDYDTGEANQPEIEVEEPENFPFPSLNAIQTELEKVMDFACVQYLTSDDVIELLKGFEKKAVLKYTASKVDYNRSISYKAFEITAKVLGSYAAVWIRMQWNKREENELMIFAPALAACLPFEEGFDIVTNEIKQSPENTLSDNISALLYFQNNRALHWIEEIKDQIKNVSSGWGILAAASKFDWQTSTKWLEAGRPLSLIALDALIYCTETGERLNRSAWIREHPPTLMNGPKPEVLANTLTVYLEKDSVPRTKRAVKQIFNNLFGTDQ